MISRQLLKQYDMLVALGITHLTTAAFLLCSGYTLPSWVTVYAYVTALACILFCRIFRPHKGFLPGIAVGIAATVIVRSINELFTNLHGPGVDYLIGPMGIGIGTIAALIYSKFKTDLAIQSGFSLGCAGALGGYFISMFFACNTVLHCGSFFSWNF